MDVCAFHPGTLGLDHTADIFQGALAGRSHFSNDHAPFLITGPGVRDEPCPGGVRGEVIEERLRHLPCEIISDGFLCLQAHVAFIRQGFPLYQSSTSRFFRAGAGDSPFALPAPTLVSLAMLIAVPPPGHRPKIGTIIADYMNVGAQPAYQCVYLSPGSNLVPVVLLDENVVAGFKLLRSRVLGVHIAPALTLKNERCRGFIQIKDHQSKRTVFCLAITQKS